MPHDPINTGYARALFEMAQAEGVLTRVQEEMFRLRELLKANPALLEFLKDPNIKHEGKRQALSDLFQGRVHPLVLDSLITLSDQDRAGRVLHVIEEFAAQAAVATEKVSGEVTTAISLDADRLNRLATELSRVTGKNVQLFQKVDPSILGGAIIQVGEQIIDGSLRRKLDQIKERLAQ
ncbi:MAG TPA: ATP synthase F1 subunit delta [Verrucomicrobiae bacterium]|nr:ATP synthase F1 subunit delta [Verrucomicrobiae bacterium]